MLNEKYEYEEYTKEEYIKRKRLNTTLILADNKAKGLPRALQIIARHFLFEENRYDTATVAKQKQLRKQAQERLREWTFGGESYGLGSYVTRTETQKITEKRCREKSLRSYSQTPEEEADALWKSFAESKEKAWSSEDIYGTLKYTNASVNAINFPLIVADAIWAGPLKERYLVAKADMMSHVYYLSDKIMQKQAEMATQENTENFSFKPVPIASNHKDKVLKYIAAYLMALYDMPEGTEYVEIRKADLANWADYQSFAGSNHALQFFYNPYFDKKNADEAPCEELFLNVEGKCRLNERFFSAFHIMLMTQEELNAFKIQLAGNGANEDYLVYSDCCGEIHLTKKYL